MILLSFASISAIFIKGFKGKFVVLIPRCGITVSLPAIDFPVEIINPVL